ncbi:MAG: hypothetical protein ACYDGR_10780 [Candidatus Dormibacteria bacterium]
MTWRGAYDSRRPSKKQIAVLGEIVDRRGSLWVAMQNGSSEPDPFRARMAADADQSASDHQAIIARERAWEEQKAGEREDAGRLGELLREILPPTE